MADMVARRQRARDAGDFTEADRIRAGLAGLGIFVVDAPWDAVLQPAEREGAGRSWVRTRAAPAGCKQWSHKRRAYCAAPVGIVGDVAIGGGRPLRAEAVWAELGQPPPPAGEKATDASTDTHQPMRDWLDPSRLHYCAGCAARYRLATRCPCPFDPRHSVRRCRRPPRCRFAETLLRLRCHLAAVHSIPLAECGAERGGAT